VNQNREIKLIAFTEGHEVREYVCSSRIIINIIKEMRPLNLSPAYEW